jgi:hypothetical protein
MIDDVTDLGPSDISDHSVLQWTLSVKTRVQSHTRHCLNYTRADMKSIKAVLQCTDWQSLFDSKSVNECWFTLKSILYDLIGRYVPVRSISSNRKKPLWLTYKAIKLVR